MIEPTATSRSRSTAFADKDVAQAAIEPLGDAGARYLLSCKQAHFEKGMEGVLSCTEERCGKLDPTVGDAAWLGNFQVKQGNLPPPPGPRSQ